MGEADGGAAVGLEVDSTEDVLEPPTMDADGGDVFDQEGDFVPLDVTMGAPQYALGRGGEGSLAIDFTGGDLLSSGAFDPRNFNTFSALSQGWVKPADLPSNAEIRDQVQMFARMHEGPQRDQNL